ncbi:MAG TPA: hypothetical protein VMZ26_11965 [Pyrinomonadaceae bacterium]|nr:hypothetical protein [Pyrinomonadaceae bacterium]
MANKVKFEIIRSPFRTWNTLFQQAADMASLIGKDRVISISHSSEGGEGIVTIWYWSEAGSNVPGLTEKMDK